MKHCLCKLMTCHDKNCKQHHCVTHIKHLIAGESSRANVSEPHEGYCCIYKLLIFPMGNFSCDIIKTKKSGQNVGVYQQVRLVNLIH